MKTENKINVILEDINKKRFNYVHALEVEDVNDLILSIEGIFESFLYEGYKANDIMEFINSMSLYCTDDINENEVFEFNIKEYLYKIYF